MLGFLLGPVHVGLWSEATGLRGAMVAVAALGVILTVLSIPLLRLSGYARPRKREDGELIAFTP